MSTLTFLRENARWLGAGFLLSFTSSYGQTYFISIFAAQIMGESGLSDGGWGGIYTLATTASAITMVWAGALLDRFRVRALVPFVLVGLALACLSMAAGPGMIMLVPVIYMLRLFGQGMSSQLAIVSMARWFASNRGRALAVAVMGFSAGQAVLPLIFVRLLTVTDWHWLWVVAAGMALVMIPVVRLLLAQERTPQSVAKDQTVAGVGGRHWTRSEVLRHPLFWLMIPMLLGPSAWGTSLFFQQVHLTTLKGWSLTGFVALFPLYTLVSVAMTLVSGWAIDRAGATRLIPFYLLPQALGFGILWFADTLEMAALAMAVLGLAAGLAQTLPAAFWAESFGTRYLGSIKAMIAAVMVFGSAIGPGISGWLIDLGVTFPQQLPGIVLYFLVAAGMATLGVAMVRRV